MGSQENWQLGTCPLSLLQCRVDAYGDATRFKSNFGGGTFAVSRSGLAEMQADESAHPRLMRWVHEQNSAGTEWPKLDTYNWQALQARPPLRATDRVREFLLFMRKFFNQQEFKFGTIINFRFADDDIASRVFAACDIEPNPSALMEIRRNAIEAGYLDQHNHITFAGHQFLEAYDEIASDSTQAFVAMWFQPNLDTELFDKTIEPAVFRAGYKAFRVDRKEHSNRIDDEIIGEIRRSRFLIADFTCGLFEVDDLPRLEHRGGVYFEAGFAQGLGLPVVWTCRKDLLERIHFDTRQYNHLSWELDKLQEFGTALERRVRAVIGQGPLRLESKPPS